MTENHETWQDLDAFAIELAEPSLAPESSWRPLMISLLPGQRSRLAALCAEYHLELADTIDRQLADLAAVRLPSAGEAERSKLVHETLSRHGGPEAYGLWAYLPWASKVAHLLGPEDYFDVITDRNRDKVTRQEQIRLSSMRVGIMGLSVGGEAAVTLAQEHLCGTIAVADFDRLDLSNLNRLNAGFDDLGVNKAVLVARRIALIDPYLDVVLYEEGVTDENVDEFLDGLDLLVEECDDLAIKYNVRQLARERGLNLLFAADECGFLSVEPYAHYDLPIFHGRLDKPQPPRDSFPTPLAFLKALTEWMGGWDQVSEVSRRSLEQVGNTLGGYPQLAGEARYAAGQLAHVARRLLIGERLEPFMGNIDLEDLLPTG